MKIFFTASLRGQGFFKNYYKKIYDEIKNLGYEHLDDEIFILSDKKYYEKIEKEGRKAYVDLYKRKIRHLQEADICVFECSLHSLSIGFLIEKSIYYNKPTVALYLKNNIPHFLAGVEEEKLIIRSYNESNLKKVLKEVINEAKTYKDKRFNFFITPKLLDHLEKISKEQGITKSKFIRNLILEHAKKRI